MHTCACTPTQPHIYAYEELVRILTCTQAHTLALLYVLEYCRAENVQYFVIVGVVVFVSVVCVVVKTIKRDEVQYPIHISLNILNI